MKIRSDAGAVLGSWRVDGHPQSIEFKPSFWDDILSSVMSDFLRLPWGGPEVGGVLFGTAEPERVRILAYRPLECEHANGPAFELTETDEAGLLELLERAKTDQDLAGLQPVGWYHSTFRWLLLTPADAKLYDQYFPELWQVAMVFLRVKSRPSLLGFFCRNADGSIGSCHREFMVFEGRPEPEPQEAPAVAAPPVSLEAFFGVRENPFSRAARLASPYWSPQHNEILATLLYGVRSRRGLMTLTGETGTGKTILLEQLGDSLNRESIEFALLLNPKTTVKEFYEFIAYDFDLDCPGGSKVAVLLALNRLLLKLATEHRTAALIVDDAQHLEWDVLEEIRMFDNLQNPKGRLLQVILAGSPELDRGLEADNLRQLRERVTVRCQLQPLRERETKECIAQQLAKSGMPNQTVFTPEVLAGIHTRSGGVLRVINAICHGLLESCFAGQRRVATIDMLDEVCLGL